MSLYSISPAISPTPRFGSGINPAQFQKAMKGLGFRLETGAGRHGSHFVRGPLSIPFSSGGHIGNIGDDVLRSFAEKLGVPLKDLKQYIREPKRKRLDLSA